MPQEMNAVSETDADDLNKLPDNSEEGWLAHLKSRNKPMRTLNAQDVYESMRAERDAPRALRTTQMHAAEQFMDIVNGNEAICASLDNPRILSLKGQPIDDEMLEKAHRFCQKLAERMQRMTHKSVSTKQLLERVSNTPDKLEYYGLELAKRNNLAAADEKPAYTRVLSEIAYLSEAWDRSGSDRAFSKSAIRGLA